MNLAARHDRNLRVQQMDQRAQDAALRLTAETEQDEVMARQHRVDELRDNGFVVADDAREQMFARLKLLNQVVADFLFYRARPELVARNSPRVCGRGAMGRFYPN